MNGIPHLQHIRSASLAGLSVVELIFDDNSDNDLGPPESIGAPGAGHASHLGSLPALDLISAPSGSAYWYTLKSTNPSIDLMELKSLQDWVISKYIRSVPDVVDDSSFGGLTSANTRFRLDPDKLVSYGLSLAQV